MCSKSCKSSFKAKLRLAFFGLIAAVHCDLSKMDVEFRPAKHPGISIVVASAFPRQLFASRNQMIHEQPLPRGLKAVWLEDGVDVPFGRCHIVR